MKQFFDIESMDKQQFLERLGQHLQELTEEQAFEVFSIATHKEKWLCVDKNNKQSHSKNAKEAEDYDLFNLVVIDHNKISGYINREDLREGQWNKMVRWNERSLDAKTKLTEVIGKLVRDSSGITRRERSPLYFVNSKLNGKSEPLGIITFWDLNRAPAYILSYACMIYLEHTLLNSIRDTHETLENHRSSADQFESRDLRSFFRSSDLSFKELSKKWFLRDLIEFCRKDKHVSPWCKEIDATLMECLDGEGKDSLRNQIAHPIRLLVRDDDTNFKDDLAKLQKLWTAGIEALRHFHNPKVRLHSRESRHQCKFPANQLEFDQ
jgi:hypothetical protein